MKTPAAQVVYQRARPRPHRLNNSVRRTYDLLRSSFGSLAPDARLVEDELVDALSASRNTVRAVLQLLADEGLVTRRPRVGTTVSTALVLPIDELVTVPEFGQGGPHVTDSRVLETQVLPAPRIVRDLLHLAEGSRVVMIEGLMLEGDEPLGLCTSYVALPDCAPAPDVVTTDVVLLLEQQLRVELGDSASTVGAVRADEQTAELLGVEEGGPVLWLEDVLHDVAGRPVALSQFRLRSDRVAFSAVARRVARA